MHKIGVYLSIFLLLGSLPAFAAPNDGPLQVRVVQTRLMVAALKCQDADIFDKPFMYHQSAFNRYGRALQTRLRGARLDRWITELSNQESRRANALKDAVCEDALSLGNRLMSIPPNGDLAQFAQKENVQWPRP